MINFTVSAPGMISLFGEHTARYRRTAVLASLNMRTALEFTELSENPESVIEIKFSQIGLSCNLLLQTFIDYFYGNYTFHDNVNLLHDRVLNFIARQRLYQTYAQKKYLKAFFFLLIYISYKEELEIKSFQVDMSADFIGTGLGNTRSCIACLAMCYFHWSRVQKNARCTYNSDDLRKLCFWIKDYIQVASKSVGIIDLIPCIFGTAFKFQIRLGAWCFDQLFDLPDMNILLVDTLQRQNVTLQTRRMENLKYSYPAIAASVFNSIDAISNKTVDILLKINQFNKDNTYDAAERKKDILIEYQKIESLTRMNQELLNILNVSNVNLDKVCSIAKKYGLSAKYTDAGRYAFIWLHEYIPNEDLTCFTQELEQQGFVVAKHKLNCIGVQIE